MTWLTWRQLRAQALTVYGAVLALAIVLAITGPRLTRLKGESLYDLLHPSDLRLFYTGVFVLGVVPAVIGAFWGAPLVARELEAGTHRLVWNQSVTRGRWLATKAGLTLTATVLGVGALSLAITWWADPIDGALGTRRGNLPSRLTPIAFGMRALEPVAMAVFAVAVGILLGVLLRRTLPAMALTIAVVAFVQIAVPSWVRPHLLPPSQQTVTISRDTLDGISGDPNSTSVSLTVRTPHSGDWVLSQQTVNLSGRAVSLPAWFAGCVAPPAAGPLTEQKAQGPDLTDCFARLNAEGFRQHVVFQQQNRFWPLQWAEAGLLLVLSALLLAVTSWRIRALS
jgi:hypothetical protein